MMLVAQTLNAASSVSSNASSSAKCLRQSRPYNRTIDPITVTEWQLLSSHDGWDVELDVGRPRVAPARERLRPTGRESAEGPVSRLPRLRRAGASQEFGRPRIEDQRVQQRPAAVRGSPAARRPVGCPIPLPPPS